TPWSNPTYNIFGWQKPCYLLQDGYADTFEQLILETEWDNYGRASGNSACQQCMVHCGYEPSAVDHTFGGLGGLVATVRSMLNRYKDPEAQRMVDEAAKAPSGPSLPLTVNGKPVGKLLNEKQKQKKKQGVEAA
ncbi:MAG: DUF3463 domain-containing protein, partial [Phycisphaeraceae bacterium]|nr:DUF3463 domain-containing protein [Phycisphaeraceae bacterium]